MFSRCLSFALVLLCAGAAFGAAPLRVCADPDNLPFSNRNKRGFDNRIAAMIAHDLGREPLFVWASSRRGFLREQFNKNACDVLMGTPGGMHGVLQTEPYYRSTYVFVTPAREHLQIASFDDPHLNGRRIGLQVLEEDYSPPSLPLIRRGYAAQLVGFESFGAQNGEIVQAVANRHVGVAGLGARRRLLCRETTSAIGAYGCIAPDRFQRNSVCVFHHGCGSPRRPATSRFHRWFFDTLAAADRTDCRRISRACCSTATRCTVKPGSIAVAVLLLIVSGCKREQRVFDPGAAGTQIASGVALTDVHAGGSVAPPSGTKYEQSAYAVTEGKRLYEAFNCVGCHAHGGGAIGPALMHAEWIYGSRPEQIYSDIVQGRPNGMPSYAGKIPDYQVWELVAYVRSMSGQLPADVAPSRSDEMPVAKAEQARQKEHAPDEYQQNVQKAKP